MADLSKIRIPNGTEYNLKDAQARADITALNGSLDTVQADLDDVNESLGDVRADLDNIQPLTDPIKNTLLNCFAHVAWIDQDGQNYYDALEAALNMSYRWLTSDDIDFQSGIVNLTVNDGNIEYTGKETSSATSFAVIMLKPSIKHIKFIYKPSGEKDLSRRPPFRMAIAKRGNNFIGCDHISSYLFTPNARGNEYSATMDTSLSTVTCSDAGFIGAASYEWDGFFNNKTFDVILENGVLTVSSSGYYCTYTNVELIGFWVDGKPCQKFYDVKVYK